MVPDVPTSSSTCSWITYASGLKGEDLMTSRGGGGFGCTHMGQSNYSMGLEWMGFCIRVTRDATLSNSLKLS